MPLHPILTCSPGLELFSDLLVFPASMVPLLAPSLLGPEKSFADFSASAHLLGLQLPWDLVFSLPGYTRCLRLAV